jgi:predicted O-methyltransferase YrrM
MELSEVLAEVDGVCRARDIRMLGPQKAVRLAELVQNERPLTVVEVGTAIGYSGLWIADVLREHNCGRLITLEMDADRAAEASRNFERAGVRAFIQQLVGDARELIRTIAGPIDFLFLDGGFGNYYPCLMNALDRIRPGGLLVADNAHVGAGEMADYLQYVRTNCESRTEWFETDLAWNPRDAMEISRVGPGGLASPK